MNGESNMRLPRLSVAHVPQHVIVRGNNSESIFKSPHDCKSYLYFLQEAAAKNHTNIHAYVLMPNHVHLLMSSDCDVGVGRTIQAVARHYVPYFNQRNSRSGALFNARYRSALVERGCAVLRVQRYIEENPVRSSMCGQPEHYMWSSYGANGLGEKESIVSPGDDYLALGRTAEERRDNYQKIFTEPQPREQIDFIRKQTNRSLVIGGESFRQYIEKRFGISLVEKNRGGDRRSKAFRQASLQRASA